MGDKKEFKPLVTIITTTYKKFTGIAETFLSVLNQDYPRIEYIISDDGSENFDRALIEGNILKYKKKNLENYQIIHHEFNLGTVKNINAATKSANGDYIIGLGLEDLFVSNDAISMIIDRMMVNDYDLLAYSRIQCSPQGVPLRRMPCPFFYHRLSKMNTPDKQYRALVTGSYYEFASGSAICSKKDLLNKLNYYDESYMYWEDGPYLAKYNLSGNTIKTAYDIEGIMYRLGGISSIKSKAPGKAVLGLKEDAYRFYCTELERNSKWLTSVDKRKIRYVIKRNRNENKIKKYLLMLLYLDVVFSRFVMKLRFIIAEKTFQ